jgi:hypothetical protein
MQPPPPRTDPIIDNDIMNDFYEANMPAHAKPQQSTSGDTVKKFVKDKYIKKLWVSEEDDPVELYQSGEYEKQIKKKEKKEKKKLEKLNKKKLEKKQKKKDAKEEKQGAAEDLIDFEGNDDGFGDFQESETKAKTQSDDFGDFVGGDDDFGDFAVPENNKNEDDFDDFVGADQASSASAPPAPFTSHQAPSNNNLINNLSNLYNQNPSQNSQEQNNKYAALENMGQQQPHQQPHQYQSNMFSGMDVNTNSFNGGFQQQQQHQNAFNHQPPGLTHQHSWNGFENSNTQDPFQSAFPQQQQMHTMNHQQHHTAHNAFSNPPAWNSVNSSNFQNNNFNYNAQQNQGHSQVSGGDMFGLKATLEQKNKGSKYNGSNGLMQNKPQNNSAFSNLVSAQWNS